MTQNDKKENLSFHYLGTIVSKNGFRFDRPKSDYGVDATIELIERIQMKTGFRYFASGLSVDVQLKCTTKKYVNEDASFVDYPLTVKNYNDLIRRRIHWNDSKRILRPMILVLVVLPDDETEWVEFGKDGCLILNGNAYWFYPSHKNKSSENLSSVKVKIPVSQVVGLDFCSKLFATIYPNIFAL